jgi:hypothetical protein
MQPHSQISRQGNRITGSHIVRIVGRETEAGSHRVGLEGTETEEQITAGSG